VRRRGAVAGDGCGATCQIERPASCGDGTLDIGAGEECDDGGIVPGDGCDGSCQLEPLGATCGDGAIDPLEVCDPPEVMPADGDGCNATCNLDGDVTTLATGVPTLAIVSDSTNLYMAIGTARTNKGASGPWARWSRRRHWGRSGRTCGSRVEISVAMRGTGGRESMSRVKIHPWSDAGRR
jgi:cysteine-rich repeat protein